MAALTETGRGGTGAEVMILRKANKAPALDGGITCWLHIGRRWRAGSDGDPFGKSGKSFRIATRCKSQQIVFNVPGHEIRKPEQPSKYE